MTVCLCKRPEGDGWVNVLAVLPEALSVVWDAVSDEIAAQVDLHPDKPVRNGQIVEILCASYLAR